MKNYINSKLMNEYKNFHLNEKICQLSKPQMVFDCGLKKDTAFQIQIVIQQFLIRC